jgi:Tfp pilus assembly protein PilF
LIEAGEGGRATELLEKVSRLHPEFLPAREQLGLGLLRRGDLEAASAQATKLIALEPRAPEGHRLMALVLWKQRQYEPSLAECAMALANDPDSSSMLALQSIELWELNRKREAQNAFRQAAQTEPKVSSAEVFCRLLLCDSRDIGMVADFLRRMRWVLAPSTLP